MVVHWSCPSKHLDILTWEPSISQVVKTMLKRARYCFGITHLYPLELLTCPLVSNPHLFPLEYSYCSDCRQLWDWRLFWWVWLFRCPKRKTMHAWVQYFWYRCCCYSGVSTGYYPEKDNACVIFVQNSRKSSLSSVKIVQVVQPRSCLKYKFVLIT